MLWAGTHKNNNCMSETKNQSSVVEMNYKLR